MKKQPDIVKALDAPQHDPTPFGKATDSPAFASGINDPEDRAAAAALSTGHPKQGLVGIHSASTITRAVRAAKSAFRNSDG